MGLTDQSDMSEEQAAIDAYREKLEEWKFRLEGDPVHAIRSQVSDMVWQDISFRVLDLARRPADGEPVCARNYFLGRFLNKGYVATQVLAISRLVDKNTKKGMGGKGKNPDFSVNSLSELVDDVKQFSLRLTRRVFVSVDGGPYDHTDKFHPGHFIFDEVSGNKPDTRLPDDLIGTKFFDRLSGMLKSESVKEVLLLRDKVLAHPANDPSMKEWESIEKYIGFDVVDQAHRDIITVFSALYGIFYRQGFEIVPVYRGELFQHMDQPYARKEMIGSMGEMWRNYSRVRNDFCNDWKIYLFNQ